MTLRRDHRDGRRLRHLQALPGGPGRRHGHAQGHGRPFPQARFCPTGGIDAASARPSWRCPTWPAWAARGCARPSWYAPATGTPSPPWPAPPRRCAPPRKRRPERHVDAGRRRPAAWFWRESRAFSRHRRAEAMDRAGTTEAVFALKGATLLDWRVLTAGRRLLELIDGYQSAAELNGQHGVRNGLLAPFRTASRTRATASTGRPRPHARCRGRCAADLPRPRTHARLPALAHRGRPRGRVGAVRLRGDPSRRLCRLSFAISLRLTVNLSASGLSLFLSAANVGSQDAPVTLGWHPISARRCRHRCARTQGPRGAADPHRRCPDSAGGRRGAGAARRTSGAGLQHRKTDRQGRARLLLCRPRPSADKLVRSTLRDRRPATPSHLAGRRAGPCIHRRHARPRRAPFNRHRTGRCPDRRLQSQRLQ